MHITLEHVTKTFGSVVACRDISLTINPGEVIVLLGENGAGKSTLMSILSGAVWPTSGQVIVDGVAVDLADGHTARNLGIGMVYQHYQLVEDFTAVQNILLGNEGDRWILDDTEMTRRVMSVADRFGLEIDPNRKVGELSVGAQQRVEIVKALSTGGRLLILDEPTAVLTPDETDRLLHVVRDLANSGCSVVFITHKLLEARQVADRIIVMRSGEVVGEAEPDADARTLTQLMVGRAADPIINTAVPPSGEPVLVLENIEILGHPGLHDLSIEVLPGEILGVGGVDGNGQAELEEVVSGLVRPTAGSISVNGERIEGRSVRHFIERIRVIPSQRSRWGMISSATVVENIVLRDYRKAPFAHRGILNIRAMTEYAQKLVDRFDVRLDRIAQTGGSLSGGNQQKVVVAREFSRSTGVLVAAQPSRGVDVGATNFIHQELLTLRNRGESILLISADLDELLALSDRIAILYKGRIMGVTTRDHRDLIGAWMAGIDEPSEGSKSE